MLKEVVIASAKRTPIGTFCGMFQDTSAVKLGEVALRAALAEIALDAALVEEVIFGNVLQAGLGQNVARQVAIAAGVPNEVPSFTINKACASGLKAVELGAQAIMLGNAEIVAVGGTENMTQAPHLLKDMRQGKKMGNTQMVDSLIADGLTDAFHAYHMGVTAENIAAEYHIPRVRQDEMACHSQNKAEAAIKAGKFQAEIAAVTIPQRKGEALVCDTDEYPRMGTTVEMLSKLRPAFLQEGTVTAGNASGINDGAAALILMSREKAEELGIKPLASICGIASAGVRPEVMGTGPIPASKKAFERCGLTAADMDLIEANEAFAVQAQCVVDELGLPMEKVNVNGGAIALGHPIGASGARILVTLVHEMQKRKSHYGLATLCVGGGQGLSMIVKGVQED